MDATREVRQPRPPVPYAERKAKSAAAKQRNHEFWAARIAKEQARGIAPATVVAMVRVDEYFDHKDTKVGIGTQAAATHKKQADPASINWVPGGTVSKSELNPQGLTVLTPAVAANEKLRVIYDRDTVDGQPIKEVELLYRYGAPDEGTPYLWQGEGLWANYKSGVMDAKKGLGMAGSRGFEVVPGDENIGKDLLYVFKITLEDGSTRLDRGLPGRDGLPTAMRARVAPPSDKN